MTELLKYIKLCGLIIRYGRFRHSGHDFNAARAHGLAGLEEFIPKQPYKASLRPGEKFFKWLLKNPVIRSCISAAAFAKYSYRKQGTHLRHPLLRLSYIRIPKSGSTSINYAMLQSIYSGLGEKQLSPEVINFLADVHLEKDLAGARPGEIFFAVIRNPFARIVSVYRDFFERAEGSFIYRDYLFGILQKGSSFKEFVRRLEGIPDALKDQHLKPQSLFLQFYEDKKINIVVLKLEKTELVRSFLATGNLEFPELNRSTEPYDYRSYYDREIFERVARIYRQDIGLFHYEEEMRKLEGYIKNGGKD